MSKQPLCRYCGKAIRKRTRSVLFNRPDNRGANPYTICRPEKPKSRKEAQGLFNETIVSLRWTRGEEYGAKQAGFDYISTCSIWDGESYEDEFFCNGEHARMFGYAAARMKDRTLAMPAWFEAVKKQKS